MDWVMTHITQLAQDALRCHLRIAEMTRRASVSYPLSFPPCRAIFIQ